MPDTLLPLLRRAGLAGLLAAILAVPFLGLTTETRDLDNGLSIATHWPRVGWAALAVFAGRLLLDLAGAPLALLAAAGARVRNQVGDRLGAALPTAGIARATPPLLLAAAVALPFLPVTDRYVLDTAITVLIYILLGLGLNVTVGLAGLLDLGYVAFYAIGAYTCALATTELHLGFWAGLALGGLAASLFAIVLSLPILRLRGDYLAIVTLGFGQITQIVILNWQSLTGGPNGIAGIPRPTLFGLSFERRAADGEHTFSQITGIAYSSEHRLIFLYLVILGLALGTALVVARLRRLPIGRAWEALRENEIACRSLGINPVSAKVTAYAAGAAIGGLAGGFFATRQGFISPESFGYSESLLVLIIVVLGGMGRQAGIVIAALFIVITPELARELADYRLLAFGLIMILVMIWRPQGLLSGRTPTVLLPPLPSALGPADGEGAPR